MYFNFNWYTNPEGVSETALEPPPSPPPSSPAAISSAEVLKSEDDTVVAAADNDGNNDIHRDNDTTQSLQQKRKPPSSSVESVLEGARDRLMAEMEAMLESCASWNPLAAEDIVKGVHRDRSYLLRLPTDLLLPIRGPLKMMLFPRKEVHFDVSEVVVADEVKVGKEEEEKDWMMEEEVMEEEVTAKKKMEIDEKVTEAGDHHAGDHRMMINKGAEEQLNFNNNGLSTASVQGSGGHFNDCSVTPLFDKTSLFVAKPKVINSSTFNSAALTTAKTAVAAASSGAAPVTIPRPSYHHLHPHHHSSLKRPLSNAHDSGQGVEFANAGLVAKPAPPSRAVPAAAAAVGAVTNRGLKRNRNNNNNNNNLNSSQITGPPAKCLGLFCPQVTTKDSCRSSFTDKLTLEAHLVAEHGGLPAKKCPAPGCTQLYQTNEQILLHFGKAHRGTDVQTLHCEQCPRPMAFPVDFRKDEASCRADLLVFMEHQAFAHEQGVFQCGQAGCRFLAPYRSSIERHYFLKHHHQHQHQQQQSGRKRAMVQGKEKKN